MNKFLLTTTLASAVALAIAKVFAAPVHVQPADTPAGWLPQQAPGFYRLRLGDFRVTVLSDGTASRDLPGIMSNPGTVRQAFAQSHQTLPVELSINCFLVDTGSKKILIDAGAGELFGTSAGRLVANMHAAGYAPEDVDAVLLTHIHGDHSGGLSVGGKRVFPNALVYVDRRDPDYWLDRDHEKQVPEGRRRSFQQSRQTVDPYVQAGMLRTFDGPAQLFDGVRSMPEYGHTPGMSGYMLESRGERLFVWGDIVHAAEVQFATPAISIDYDVDASVAVATRNRVLASAAADGVLVGGAHLSFPGIGHVAVEQGTYRWVPIPYMTTP